MAVKTEIWVKGHIRQCFAAGLMCALARKGAPEAGVVYVSIRRQHDEHVCLGPAPGPAYDELGRRRWTRLFDGRPVTQSEFDEFISRQTSFDPDIWVLDIDDPDGTGLIDPESIS